MTIHWKAVEQYFTVVLFVNPLTPRMKPWMIQSFLTFDSMDRTLKCDHSLESCLAVLYCGAVCFSILISLLSEVKGLILIYWHRLVIIVTQSSLLVFQIRRSWVLPKNKRTSSRFLSNFLSNLRKLGENLFLLFGRSIFPTTSKLC